MTRLCKKRAKTADSVVILRRLRYYVLDKGANQTFTLKFYFISKPCAVTTYNKVLNAYIACK